MPSIETSSTLAELVTVNPGLARELERRNLDYCCGGQRTLAEACSEVGLDPDTTATELEWVESTPAGDWVGLDPAALTEHLEETHHVYLKEELPRLAALAAKVRDVHGERHPELTAVHDTFMELRYELEPHLEKEEQILFPMIRELGAADEALEFHCGSLGNPIRVMLMEHDAAGDLLVRLRDLSGGYTPPGDACASYEALYVGLAALEEDTHMHIHKENNALFPAVLEMEAARQA